MVELKLPSVCQFKEDSAFVLSDNRCKSLCFHYGVTSHRNLSSKEKQILLMFDGYIILVVLLCLFLAYGSCKNPLSTLEYVIEPVHSSVKRHTSWTSSPDLSTTWAAICISLSHYFSVCTMSVPYERYDDDITIEDHERSGSESDPEEHEQRLQRAHMLFGNRWPKQNGVLQLSVGFILTFLGKLISCTNI